MAVENALQSISYPAASDQSANQYRFMELNASGQISACNAAGEASIGVLQDNPAAVGRAGAVAINGQTKVVLGATVAVGAKVATDAQGRAVTAATGNIELGTCTEGGIVGTIGSIVFNPGRTAP